MASNKSNYQNSKSVGMEALKNESTPFLTEEEIKECNDPNILRKWITDYESRITQTQKEIESVKQEKVEIRRSIRSIPLRQEGLLENVQNEIVNLVEMGFKCSLCTCICIKPTVTNCCHSFCSFCITEWRRLKSTCPTCNEFLLTATRNFFMTNFLELFFKKFENSFIGDERRILVAEREEMEEKAVKAQKDREFRGEPDKMRRRRRLYSLQKWEPGYDSIPVVTLSDEESQSSQE